MEALAETPAMAIDGHNLENLLKVLKEHCTRQALGRLLQKAKAIDPKVRITAENKDQLIQRNVRDAMNRLALLPADVCNELFDAEENGGQHIFYYKPVRPTDGKWLEQMTADAVAERLFGKDWQETIGIPRFLLKPQDVQWSHFREVEYPEGKTGWLAKAYGGIERKKLVLDKQRGKKIYKIWELELKREVYIAKWHPFGILEIRIPMAETRDEVLEGLIGFWKMLQPGINRDDFADWDLAATRANLKKNAEQSGTVYRLGPIRLIDKQRGATTVCPPSSEESVCSDRSRAETLKLFAQCAFVSVTWLPQGQLEDDMRVLIGKLATNEVMITAKATADAVDYLTYRLREFAA